MLKTNHKVGLNQSDINLDAYINKANGIIYDMGSYILSALAVGAVIGIYIYYRSNSNTNTGGPGGGNLLPNGHIDSNGIRPT
jgi:hypothetical protein